MVFKTAFTRLFFRAKVENLTSIKKKCFYLSVGCKTQI